MYAIKSRIWIENDQGVFLGEGRIQLLKAIEKEGSLSKAAKNLGISYKKAWKLIDSINKNAQSPMVITNTGGNGGGGTTITSYAQEMIQKFDIINKNCWDFLDQQLKEYQM